MSSSGGRARNQAVFSRAHITLLTVLIFLSLALLFVWLILFPSTEQQGLLELFDRRAETSDSGVSADEYPRLSEAIAGYLVGSRPSPQIEVEANEGFRAAFYDHELFHLRDVKALLDLSRWLLCAILTLLLLAALLFIRGQMIRLNPSFPFLLRSIQLAAGALFLLILTVAIWCILDFDGAFTALHRLVFRNEFWLLDPRQDLLIQLMPQSFFEDYALEGIKKIGVVLVCILALPEGFRLLYRWRKH